MKLDDIKKRLEQLNSAQPKRSLGQNFLISETVIQKILSRVQSELQKLDSSSYLIEVGPGLGSLTEELLTLNCPIKLIELDREFVQFWKQHQDQLKAQATELANSRAQIKEIFEADALQMDWSQVAEEHECVFVSNLPYQISSSLVIERSIAPFKIKAMVLMFQKEVAQRLTAKASTAEYGLLTAVAQSFWNIQNVSDASPRDFYPAPRVASRVLGFQIKNESPNIEYFKENRVRNEYLQFLKRCFSHRRKLMFNNLVKSKSHEKTIWENVFLNLKLNPQLRAEENTPEKFIEIFKEYQRLV